MIDFTKTVTAEDKARQARDAVVSRIASRRWEEETAGITVEGLSIDTSRDSQALITGAAVAAMLDPNYSLQWKTLEGFCSLTAAQVLLIAGAVRSHIQACFDRESELLKELDTEGFSEESIQAGWPTA